MTVRSPAPLATPTRRLTSIVGYACAAMALLATAAGDARAQQDGTVPPQLPPPPSEAVKGATFDTLEASLFALTPAQIERLKQKIDENQRAVAKPVRPAPKSRQRTISVSLEPGAAEPEIAIAPGKTTTLRFLDITGRPWPVVVHKNGNNEQIDVEVPVQGSNVVFVNSKTSYPSGNITILLQGEDAPVVVSFNVVASAETKDNVVDTRRDIRIEARGPGAAPSIIAEAALPVAGDETIMAVLDGVPPQGATPLDVSGDPSGGSRAWRVGDRMFLRTKMQVLSPSWTQHTYDPPSGTVVYELPQTPLVMVSIDGNITPIKLSERGPSGTVSQ